MEVIVGTGFTGFAAEELRRTGGIKSAGLYHDILENKGSGKAAFSLYHDVDENTAIYPFPATMLMKRIKVRPCADTAFSLRPGPCLASRPLGMPLAARLHSPCPAAEAGKDPPSRRRGERQFRFFTPHQRVGFMLEDFDVGLELLQTFYPLNPSYGMLAFLWGQGQSGRLSLYAPSARVGRKRFRNELPMGREVRGGEVTSVRLSVARYQGLTESRGFL